MNTKYLTLAAAVTGLFVLTHASARLLANPAAITMSPLNAYSFEIGDERAVTYFLSDNGQCKLVHTQARKPDWKDETFTATRFEATIDAGKAARYVSSDGSAIDFECRPDARSVSIRGLAPALADAR